MMDSINLKRKVYLEDVVVLRLSLIVLLVLYHSFCIFSGAWEVPKDYPLIPIYWWIAKTSYSFMLETFVFISGYLFGFQVQKNGIGIICFKNTILKKAKRLLLPCFFFGVIYYTVFYDLSKPVYEISYSIMCGTGHLWFLPMLFWCFTVIYLIERLKVSYKVVLPLLALVALCSFIPLPFRMSNSMYYSLFFYIGYCIKRYSWGVRRFFTKRSFVSFGILYLISFVIFNVINNYLVVKLLNVNIFNKLFHVLYMKFFTLCYSLFGMLMIFSGINWLFKESRIKLNGIMIKLSGLCFGVYICQQFILKIIYYQMGGLNKIDPVFLPWIGFVITLALSLFISHYILKTRLGRFLIG